MFTNSCKRLLGYGEYDTKYYGIYVCSDLGHFWIYDTNGNERHVGMRYPDDTEIDSFRDAVLNH